MPRSFIHALFLRYICFRNHLIGQEDLEKLKPEEWSSKVREVIGGGGGGKGNTFTGTSQDITQVDLAADIARDFLKLSLGE